MTRILVASRSNLARDALESRIRSNPALEFAGTVNPVQLSAANPTLPQHADVMLIEATEPNEYDWRALAELPVPVLLLLDSTDPALATSALQAGIRGAIPWDATGEEIEAAARAVQAGLMVTAPAFLAELAPDAQPPARELVEPLSDRELEVLDLLTSGLSNKLIAHQLSISEHTVKTHVASIFTKLNVSTRTEAASQAIRRGLVML